MIPPSWAASRSTPQVRQQCAWMQLQVHAYYCTSWTRFYMGSDAMHLRPGIDTTAKLLPHYPYHYDLAAGAGQSFTSPGWLTQLNMLWGGKGVSGIGHAACRERQELQERMHSARMGTYGQSHRAHAARRYSRRRPHHVHVVKHTGNGWCMFWAAVPRAHFGTRICLRWLVLDHIFAAHAGRCVQRPALARQAPNDMARPAGMCCNAPACRAPPGPGSTGMLPLLYCTAVYLAHALCTAAGPARGQRLARRHQGAAGGRPVQGAVQVDD